MSLEAAAGVTLLELEFDTGTRGGALLGDIATSLVSIDELLRDLGSMAAYPLAVEFRKVEIVAIELRSPLRIRLSLIAISPEAIKAFQGICRDIILFRSRRGSHQMQSGLDHADVLRLSSDKTVLVRTLPEAVRARVTEQELDRLAGHVAALQRAEIPLKRVEVKHA